ncbi:MAG: RNA polymerase sigma factor [Nannocystales bacterium]
MRASAPPPHERVPPTLDELYRAHADFVWRTVLRLGIAEAQAEDAVHEVYLVVRRKLPQFRGDAAATTWLYAIARGVCANLRRKHDRAERRLDLVAPPTPAPDPEDAASRADAAALVQRFLAQLPQEQREVFVLSDIEGMPGPDVAAALRIPLGTAYSRLRLARRRLEAFVHGGKDG